MSLAHYTVELMLALEEGRTVEVRCSAPCARCNGTGEDTSDPRRPVGVYICPRCRGSRRVVLVKESVARTRIRHAADLANVKVHTRKETNRASGVVSIVGVPVR